MRQQPVGPWHACWLAARDIFGRRDLRRPGRLLRFAAQAWRHRAAIGELVALGQVGGFLASFAARPRVLGLLVWPYLHSGWEPGQRLQALHAHYLEVNELPWLQVPIGQQLVVAELSDVHPGLSLAVDRPSWFLREGELSLNLFVGEVRVYSVAFCFGRNAAGRLARIGSIQGRSIEGAEELYRDLTKALHGARPRDFILSALQALCEQSATVRLLAVADRWRHHRHAYFAGKVKVEDATSYDDIWADRGGQSGEDGFFELPAAIALRPMEEIASKKRALYRRRYELLARVQNAFAQLKERPEPQYVSHLRG